MRSKLHLGREQAWSGLFGAGVAFAFASLLESEFDMSVPISIANYLVLALVGFAIGAASEPRGTGNTNPITSSHGLGLAALAASVVAIVLVHDLAQLL
ncbi:MAG: hypothetical protein ACRDHF_18660 [Tepidiformaceae bacterium]